MRTVASCASPACRAVPRGGRKAEILSSDLSFNGASDQSRSLLGAWEAGGVNARLRPAWLSPASGARVPFSSSTSSALVGSAACPRARRCRVDALYLRRGERFRYILCFLLKNYVKNRTFLSNTVQLSSEEQRELIVNWGGDTRLGVLFAFSAQQFEESRLGKAL